MIMRFSDPFEALLNFQKQLDARLASDWLENSTANIGAYPPINIFQQGDDFVASRERLAGSFDRTITLPVRVDPDRIKAEYGDGILALFIPRAESDKPRVIGIE